MDRLAKVKTFFSHCRSLVDETKLALRGEKRLTRAEKILQFCLMVGRGFLRNRCPVRAGALAYTTILGMVPVLALVVGISTVFLKSQEEERVTRIIEELVSYVAPQVTQIPTEEEEPGGREQVVEWIRKLIHNISGGTLGVASVGFIIIIAITLLSSIEEAFNDIWGIEKGRSWFTRIVVYWAAMTLGGIMIFSAFGLIPFGMKFLSFFIVTFIFAILYKFMPHTTVHWSAALLGAVVGGILWQFTNIGSFLFASRALTYREIFAGLALVPLFMFGLYLSWLMVLFGAQVAYSFQNRRAYYQKLEAESANFESRELLALHLMTRIGGAFKRGKVSTSTDMAESLDVPTRLVTEVLAALVATNLLVEVGGDEIGYHPARPLNQIRIDDILKGMRRANGENLLTSKEQEMELVTHELYRIREAESGAASESSLQDLIDRVEEDPKEGQLLAEGENDHPTPPNPEQVSSKPIRSKRRS